VSAYERRLPAYLSSFPPDSFSYHTEAICQRSTPSKLTLNGSFARFQKSGFPNRRRQSKPLLRKKTGTPPPRSCTRIGPLSTNPAATAATGDLRTQPLIKPTTIAHSVDQYACPNYNLHCSSRAFELTVSNQNEASLLVVVHHQSTSL